MKAHQPVSQACNEPVEFSEAMMTKVKELIASYPEGKHKSALIRILHLVQSEKGWVSVPSMDKVAEILNIQPIEVYEVDFLHDVSFGTGWKIRFRSLSHRTLYVGRKRRLNRSYW